MGLHKCVTTLPSPHPCGGGHRCSRPAVPPRGQGPVDRLQIRLLERALQLVEVGGRVVYSTCSFNPIENEAVVAAMLLTYPGTRHGTPASPGSCEILTTSAYLESRRETVSCHDGRRDGGACGRVQQPARADSTARPDHLEGSARSDGRTWASATAWSLRPLRGQRLVRARVPQGHEPHGQNHVHARRRAQRRRRKPVPHHVRDSGDGHAWSGALVRRWPRVVRARTTAMAAC